MAAAAATVAAASATTHNGSKQLFFLSFTFLQARKLSEHASEQMSARAKHAVQSKQMSERCERMREHTSEWPSTYVQTLRCFKPTCIGNANKILEKEV